MPNAFLQVHADEQGRKDAPIVGAQQAVFLHADPAPHPVAVRPVRAADAGGQRGMAQDRPRQEFSGLEINEERAQRGEEKDDFLVEHPHGDRDVEPAPALREQEGEREHPQEVVERVREERDLHLEPRIDPIGQQHERGKARGGDRQVQDPAAEAEEEQAASINEEKGEQVPGGIPLEKVVGIDLQDPHERRGQDAEHERVDLDGARLERLLDVIVAVAIAGVLVLPAGKGAFMDQDQAKKREQKQGRNQGVQRAPEGGGFRAGRCRRVFRHDQFPFDWPVYSGWISPSQHAGAEAQRQTRLYTASTADPRTASHPPAGIPRTRCGRCRRTAGAARPC